eukprot:6457561-Amphidinium_carterae.1
MAKDVQISRTGRTSNFRDDGIKEWLQSFGLTYDEHETVDTHFTTRSLIRDARLRFRMALEDKPPRRKQAAQHRQSWGKFCSAATFNVNRMSWSRLPRFLEILEHEVSWSVLALQEILDDTPDLSIETGWWQVGSNHLLVTRTHPTLLMALLLHRSFVPAELPSCDIEQFMVACTCEIFSTNVRLIACYLPHSGHDLVHPSLFHQALEEAEGQLNENDHCILLGDYNSWLGCSLVPGLPIGPHNLEKQNFRGVELNHWLALHGLVVSSTFFPHSILETRCSSNSVSSLDYIATTPLVHSFFCACDVVPVASRSDHLLVRLQAKECRHHRRSRLRGKKRLDWSNPDNIERLNQLLPTSPPGTLSSWRDVLVDVSQAVAQAEVSVDRAPWRAWDTFARELRHRRSGAKGNER